MKKIKRRAYSALLVAICLIAGMGVYIYRFATQGESWANFSANEAVWSNGKIITGTITDRNGILLSGNENGKRSYAEDDAVRIACLHAVGDPGGNIGTGALRCFPDALSGYSALTGLKSGGGELALSIDAKLCAVAYDALAGHSGAVLLSDYTTGEILCMVSSPSYDVNLGFPADNPAYDGVYLNRTLSAAYTPGSVFKLVTLAAALETIGDLKSRSFVCEGSVLVDGNQINCTGVHGAQTIEQALAHSCNCAFAQLSLELGGDTLAAYAERYGFTAPLSLSGIATAAGKFEAAAPGSAALAWSGIGQSTDLVCPYALLRYVSAVAGGGELTQPSILAHPDRSTEQLINAATAADIKAMMNYAVAYSYGAQNFPGLKLCAKSGTAEVGDGTSHAWFTGFLDDPAHPYAFVVVMENAGGGLRNAGAAANTVLQAAVGN